MKFLNNLFKFVFSKQFAINLGLLLMVYFIITIFAIYYLNSKTNHGEKIEVPNYIGKNIREVSTTLEILDLEYEVVDSIYDPKKAEGTIIFQDPAPTKLSDVYVKEGRKIRFRVSKKTKLIEIPLLVDRSERFALSILKNMGINAVITYQPSEEAAGAVLQQKYKNKNMQEGERVPIGSTIYLVVGQSSLSAEMLLPDVSCLTINQVRERFSQYPGITLYETFEGCRTKADSSNAKVVFQSPSYEEGVKLKSGSTFSITLNLNGCN